MSSTREPSDQIWELLAHPMRRSLLYLIRGAEPMTVEALARDLIKSDKHQLDGGQAPEELNHVSVALHHRHLPKMAEAGVIDYDPSEGIIETTDNADLAYDLLDAISGDDGA